MKPLRSVAVDIVSDEIPNLRSAALIGSLQDGDGAGVVDMGAIESSSVCSFLGGLPGKDCCLRGYGGAGAFTVFRGWRWLRTGHKILSAD
jgi:hypothetical protein